MNPLFTIGHSTHSEDHLFELLGQFQVQAVADVRSSPYSRMNPQFNRAALQRACRRRGIQYVFLGEELGARSADPSVYLSGRVQYSRLAQTELFQTGIQRLLKGLRQYRIALLCAEKDPITCHRTILVCRELRDRPVHIEHILADGAAETQAQAEIRLLEEFNLAAPELFADTDELLQRAYELQGERIAYDRGAVSQPSIIDSEFDEHGD
jgi:uncharacterized protein (DUF488 family)